MSNFVIFEDQENVHEKGASTFADARKDRLKQAPLTNKAINNENALEKQVRKFNCLPLFLFVVTTFCVLSLGPKISEAIWIIIHDRQCCIQAEKRVHYQRRCDYQAKGESARDLRR